MNMKHECTGCTYALYQKSMKLGTVTVSKIAVSWWFFRRNRRDYYDEMPKIVNSMPPPVHLPTYQLSLGYTIVIRKYPWKFGPQSTLSGQFISSYYLSKSMLLMIWLCAVHPLLYKQSFVWAEHTLFHTNCPQVVNPLHAKCFICVS